MKNIILAFDSFKGCMSSTMIMEAAKKAISMEYPQCNVISYPIADGGEGTISAVAGSMNVRNIEVEVHNPIMDMIMSTYGIVLDSNTAIIEMALASGLPLIPKSKQNPMLTTTYGTGELIKDALDKGCRNIVLGIGGSATNDAGIGVMTALGAQFLDKRGNILKPIGGNLIKISAIDLTNIDIRLSSTKFSIACDVNNPFCGENGAAYIYSPQKGASLQDVVALDEGLRHYAKILNEEMGIDILAIPGAGAAGGVGGGLLPFLNAELKSGIDIILGILHFEEKAKDADLIFTGEGKIDSQTGMGKALGGIMKIAKKYDIPVIALCGAIENNSSLNGMGLTGVFSIQPGPVSLEKAMDVDFALKNIENAIIQILRVINKFNNKQQA